MRIARDRSRLRIARLAGELHRLLEALQREHDAAGQRGEHAVEAERHEAAAGVEVRGVELRRSATTPTARNGTAVFQITTIDVAVREELRAGEVDRGEQHHQHDARRRARCR